MTEIELKLSLSPEDVAAFRRAAPLAGVRPRRRKLTSIYYDTPECELARAGVALRLRKAGGRWTQTLKGGASGTGGLHERGEWESPRPDASIDLAGLGGTPLATLTDAEGLHNRLKPAFTVDIQRETWSVEPSPGTRMEVALDRGEALAGSRTDPVCEVEIELLEGDRAATFAFAHALLDSVSLRPSAVTKAERGYRLLSGEALQPAKSRGVALDAAMTPRQAARIVIAAALDQVQANEEGLLTSTDPEFVHQARVGLRRLRSALRMFRDLLPPGSVTLWNEESGEVARVLGAARDWDVFAMETLPPLTKAFGDAPLARALSARTRARRRRAREAARAALRSPRHARLVLDLARWLGDDASAPEGGAETLSDFASRVVRKRHKRLLSDARNLSKLSAVERHAIRIDAKRLRYGVDGFATLFKSRRVAEYVETLAALQEVLGRANDAATAARLLGELSPPKSFAAFARGWLAARMQGDLGPIDVLLKRLAATRRFWRRTARPATSASAP